MKVHFGHGKTVAGNDATACHSSSKNAKVVSFEEFILLPESVRCCKCSESRKVQEALAAPKKTPKQMWDECRAHYATK